MVQHKKSVHLVGISTHMNHDARFRESKVCVVVKDKQKT